MSNTFKKVCDFMIRIIMLFTTLVALVFFAGYYPQNSFIFSIIALIFVLTIIIKGLIDIFSKD